MPLNEKNCFVKTNKKEMKNSLEKQIEKLQLEIKELEKDLLFEEEKFDRRVIKKL